MWFAGMFLAGAWASCSLVHWAVRNGYYEIEDSRERLKGPANFDRRGACLLHA